jgi:hypothetical protein
MKFFYSDNDMQHMVYQLDSEEGLEYYYFGILKSHIRARFGDKSLDVLTDGVEHFWDGQYRINVGTIGYNLWRDILVAAEIPEREKIELGM